MYPPRFAYHAPLSLDEALSLLDGLGEEGNVLQWRDRGHATWTHGRTTREVAAALGAPVRAR